MDKENQLIPYRDLDQMANTMASSRMFGKDKTQLLALMLIAQAEGLHPATAAMEYDVINGRPALKGQAALARFQKSGGSVKWLVRTDQEAKAIFSHPQGGDLTVSWTMDRAQKMGLTGKDNWKKQQMVMLSWRCIAEGIRVVFPACLNRMYLSEEVQDFDNTPRNVTEYTADVIEPEIIKQDEKNEIIITEPSYEDIITNAEKQGKMSAQDAATWRKKLENPDARTRKPAEDFLSNTFGSIASSNNTVQSMADEALDSAADDGFKQAEIF